MVYQQPSTSAFKGIGFSSKPVAFANKESLEKRLNLFVVA